MTINLFGQYEIIWQSFVGTADEYRQQSIEHSSRYAIESDLHKKYPALKSN